MNIFRKRKNPADSAAQHLANLLGTSVAGIIPETKNGKPPELDLSTELFLRNNVSIAPLVVISGLMKSDHEKRSILLKEFQLEYFQEKSFERYMVSIILSELQKGRELVVSELESKIDDFGVEVWGEPSNKRSLQGDRFKWNQILSFEPTMPQIERAIELCRDNAKRNGWIK